MKRHFVPFSLNVRGRLIWFDQPAVMAIVNVTPDSFYAPSRHMVPSDAARTARAMLDAGADMLDIGAYSSRPGADDVSPAEETDRLCAALDAIRAEVGNDVPISVDTFRAAVARTAVESHGADIVNDISGGQLDDAMWATVADLHCPYVLMHMRGTPATMQSLADYDDVCAEVASFISHGIARLHAMGVADVIADPGFGFAKTLEQNYALLRNLGHIVPDNTPVLAGLSRKSMLSRLEGVSGDSAIDAATAAANTIALLEGASILRVHHPDRAAAARAVVASTFNTQSHV